MDSEKLNTVMVRFETEEYPLEREAAAKRFEGVRLLLADGEADLGSLVRKTLVDSFDSAEDLFVELQTALPIAAVGEPGQSDGDA